MKVGRLLGICCTALFMPLFLKVADAEEDPRPPCGSTPVPTYPDAIGPPKVQSRTVTGWAAPACLNWDGPPPTLLVAIAGRLHVPGGADILLARFGAVSRLKGVRYWSVTEQVWKILILDAFAVTDAAGTNARSDFRLDELRPGLPLYAAQRDSRSSGATIYRMRVTANTPNRIVVNVVNVSPVRGSLVTLFRPGELQATYFLERLDKDNWGYFGLSGITTGWFGGGHAASAVNRAAAFYRHYADIPTDQEPPLAR